MTDPFLSLTRAPRTPPKSTHSVRAHSKLSASGSERWFNCPGSVELSEGLPDKTSPWAEEGTRAHEVLEAYMRILLSGNDQAVIAEWNPVLYGTPREMHTHAENATRFILKLHTNLPGSDVLVEDRVYLSFIHPEMFGTYDGAVVDHFGVLHVFDYKYGAGYAVSPRENLQMIFYAIGLAHQFNWNFKRVRVWIIQPRIRGYDGPVFWEMSISELKFYVERFRKAVARVKAEPLTYVEGSWCHYCKAKSICPEKRRAKLEAAKSIFSIVPFEGAK